MILALCAVVIVLAVLWLLVPSTPKYRADAPPFYPSMTSIGPIGFILNPLEFVSHVHKELKSDSFTCLFLRYPVTFIQGRANVEAVVEAKPDKLAFAEAYELFIRPGFGPGILGHKTAPLQVDLLTRYLTDKHLSQYINTTQRVARRIFQERLRSTTYGALAGERLSEMGPQSQPVSDLAKTVLEATFNAATSNLLGEEFVVALKDFDFDDAFSKFDVISQFSSMFIPGVESLQRFIDKIRPYPRFTRSVFDLASKIDFTLPPKNVFEEIIMRKDEKDPGLTLADPAIAVNLIKFFVFGTGFNSYNMMVYFLRDTLHDQKLWNELREEQLSLDRQYGPDASSEKLASMKLLKRELRRVMAANCFPLLFRLAVVDFPLPDGRVIPRGDRIAFSPRLEHERGVDLTFGKGVHACPAEKYAWNSMRIILGELIKYYDFNLVGETKKPVNRRVVTFPTQPPLRVQHTKVLS